MAASATQTDFVVWGIDQTPYGPVELPTLVAWVKDERVTADTWIYDAKNSAWQKAASLPELQMFFRHSKSAGPASSGATSEGGLDPRALRRIKILASMTDDQLERFAQFMQVEKAPQWAVIVTQGERGDSMYFILEGELRVRINVMGKETILATLTVGDFFGDISLFDQGPRSADVVANTDSLLVKVSSSAFDQLSHEAPEIATPFLRAIGRTLTARIRADNKRFGDSVKFGRAAGAD
ncbi:MAG TPA: cyclic nucleotide-binding domain-containing protein [Candidatus Acidoferrum sp.]|nr:cyclic nucleotide-binding domain-containing protein [Candidatus Acidoferrum sp.]